MEIYDLPELFSETESLLDSFNIKRAIVVSKDKADYPFAQTVSKIAGKVKCARQLTCGTALCGCGIPVVFLANHRISMLTVKEKLPDFWNLSQKTAFDLQAGKFSDSESLIEKITPLLDESLIESMDKVIPGWKKIATLNDGQTALHTLLVFSLCLILPEYTLAAEQTRMEIEWAAVLHDLDKNLARSDTAHPFRSAAVTAGIMPKLGFELLPNINETDLKIWSNLVMSAQRPDGERMIHDHSSLKEIIDGIYQCWGRDSSAARVLKAVLLHQSLPTVQEWSNPVLLTDEELSYSLTWNDVKVLGALMIADSDSWNIFAEVRSSFLYELRASNAETRNRIQRVVKK